MDVFFLYMGVAFVFVFAGICINTLHTEGKRQKRIKAIVRDAESWCSKNCLTYEMCHSNHKDPDDAWKELEEHCMNCPMAEALYENGRSKKVAGEKSVKPCCGNCKEYNGIYCTVYWNNLDECYKDTERDSREPEDDACEYWEYDEDNAEEEQ